MTWNEKPYFILGIGHQVWMILILLITGGCERDQVKEVRIAYYDLTTKQIIVTAACTEYPAIHPETGLPTLMPAMYCPTCNAWRRVPMPDELNRAPRPIVCFHCKNGLIADGPLPDPDDE